MIEQPAKPPIINVRGKLVGLGPFLPEHNEIYYMQYLQDPQIAVLGQGTFKMRPHINPANDDAATSVTFTIYELQNMTMIGESILADIDHQHGTARFGITIGLDDYWGKGYGLEASQLVLDYGFRYLNLHNIWLNTTSFNERAQKAYRKLGFTQIGRRRGSLLVAGHRYDDIYMDLLASEFLAPSPGWPSIP